MSTLLGLNNPVRNSGGSTWNVNRGRLRRGNVIKNRVNHAKSREPVSVDSLEQVYGEANKSRTPSKL